MKKIALTAVVAAALAGCVSAPTKPIASNASLQGKRLVLSEYAKPDFSAMTAGKAEFGLFGALAMIHDGNELVKNDGIADPAIDIGQQLAKDLATQDADTVMPGPTITSANDNPSTLVKTYPGADLIIDVKTINWMYAYYPTKWGTYHINYAARVRLLDGSTGAIVAQQMCKIQDPTDPKDSPSRAALTADHGALLKRLLKKAGDSCVENFEHQVLKA
jgi:hypothetical protein